MLDRLGEFLLRSRTLSRVSDSLLNMPPFWAGLTAILIAAIFIGTINYFVKHFRRIRDLHENYVFSWMDPEKIIELEREERNDHKRTVQGRKTGFSRML